MAKKETSKDVVKKHTGSIHIGSVGDKPTLLQRKLVNALLLNAYDTLLTQKKHSISVSALAALVGFESNDISHIKKSLTALATMAVQWDLLNEDGDKVWGVSSFLASAEISKGICTYEYSETLANNLYEPERFALINMAVQRRISTGNALALYETCYRFVNIGQTRWLTLEQFRKLMGIDGNKHYKAFYQLNAKVIKPSIAEVNKNSDIIVNFEVKKTGRATTHIKFHVKKNPQLSMLDMEEEDHINQLPAYKSLIEAGISKLLARQMIVEHGQEFIQEKLDFMAQMELSGKIKSTSSGFLIEAIKKDYKRDAGVKKKADSKRDSKAQDERTLQELSGSVLKLKKAFRKHKVSLIQALFDELNEDEQKQVRAEFLSTLEGSELVVTDFKKFGWGSSMSALNIEDFWAEKLGFIPPTLSRFAVEQGMTDLEDRQAKIKKLESAVS